MSNTARKSGFTLVELLVVIAIIGILVGLLVPAIGAVNRRVSEFSINAEIVNLETALELFRNDYGVFPPDMSDMDFNQFKRFLQQQISRSHVETDADLNAWWNATGQHLGPDSSLVFWLSGLAKNAQRPITGTGERKVFFDFANGQLEDNGSGVLRYVQRRGAKRQPFIYFNSNSYARVISNGGVQVADSDGAMINAQPYFAGAGEFPEESQDSFQIIAAGVDGEFGSMGNLGGIDPRDVDNLCSFADGRLGKILDN